MSNRDKKKMVNRFSLKAQEKLSFLPDFLMLKNRRGGYVVVYNTDLESKESFDTVVNGIVKNSPEPVLLGPLTYKNLKNTIEKIAVEHSSKNIGIREWMHQEENRLWMKQVMGDFDNENEKRKEVFWFGSRSDVMGNNPYGSRVDFYNDWDEGDFFSWERYGRNK